METFDVVVIGAGPGGYPAAIRAAQLGASVALIEKEDLGGTCLNSGCIPTKTLIGVAELFHQVKKASRFGIQCDGLSLNYSTLFAHKDQTIVKLRGGIQQLLKGNGVRVFNGAGSFTGRNRVKVSGAASVEIESKRTIIATGSSSVMPSFLPKHPRIVDSREFLRLSQLPGTLLVMGGGYIGCEIACMAAELGVKVTIVELLEDILLAFDADIRREIRRYMETTLGIRILTGKALENIQASDSAVSANSGGEPLKGDLLLVAVGRRPVTEGLELQNAGLQPNEKGFIEIDEYCQTSVPSIFAIGDVTGGVQLAHAATSQGIIAAENACQKTLRRQERIIPFVVFTSPEIGTAGLTEREAQEKGVPIKTGKFAFRGLGRGIASGHEAGFVKWIAHAQTGQLLGAQVVGAHATELIAEAAVALRAELTTEEIGRTVHAHPTFAEAWMEAAHAIEGHAIHSLPPRK